jgi:hypothetical protein
VPIEEKEEEEEDVVVVVVVVAVVVVVVVVVAVVVVVVVVVVVLVLMLVVVVVAIMVKFVDYSRWQKNKIGECRQTEWMGSCYSDLPSAGRFEHRTPVQKQYFLFSTPVKTGRCPPSLLFNGYRFTFSRTNRKGVVLTTHPYLAPSLGMSRAIPLLHLCIFIVCYGVTCCL